MSDKFSNIDIQQGAIAQARPVTGFAPFPSHNRATASFSPPILS